MDRANSIKNIEIYDDWETFTVNFQVYVPEEKKDCVVVVNCKEKEF